MAYRRRIYDKFANENLRKEEEKGKLDKDRELKIRNYNSLNIFR